MKQAWYEHSEIVDVAMKAAHLIGCYTVAGTQRNSLTLANEFNECIFTGTVEQYIEYCKAVARERAETLAKAGCSDKAAVMSAVEKLIAVEQQLLTCKQ